MEQYSVKSYECPKCDRIFERPGHIERHLQAHNNFRFVCLVCNMRFSNSKFLNEHQSKSNHKEYEILKKSSYKASSVPVSKPTSSQKPKRPKHSFKCSKCNYCAFTYANLKRHLISHQYYFYKCCKIDCKMTFRTLKLLNEHRAETGHSGKNITQKIRNKKSVIKNEIKLEKSSSDRNPNQHKSSTEMTKPDTKQSNSSNSISIDKNQIQSSETRPIIKNFRLLIQQIEEEALKSPVKKKIKCDDKKNNETDSESSSYFSACNSEEDEHHMINLRAASISQQLKLDRKRAESLKRAEKYRAQQKVSNDLIRIRKFRGRLNFQCKKCDKSFGKIGSARIHVASHINANLKCPKCKRILPNKRFLLMHLRAHNRLKFICSIGECGMKFASIKCLKKHHVNHHRLKLSDESGTDDDDKSKGLQIMTRSMSQMSDLKKYRGENISPVSSSSSSRSNSPKATNLSTDLSISSSFLKKLSTLSISKLDSENLEATAVSTTIKVVEIKNQFKLECLMCSKKFKDSFMLWSHLLKKH
ncbi:unnamed protein product [Chironomus riparius]|uniref:C2H2-type domain-containing protein n=1 Tax=Chironomus riparius TaxID=315576 RepID=A0A9N9WZS4_9DIPT|nr:unnamed protein product [Chironomus riparius]